MAIKFLNTATGITEAAGDNSTKIATTAYVDAATGAVPIGDYLPLAGGTMTGTNGIVFPTDFKLNLGATSELQIFYNDTVKSNILALGLLYLNSPDIRFSDGGGGAVATFTKDGSNAFYYNAQKKLETTSTGVTVTGGADAVASITGTTTAARLDLITNSHHKFLQTIESDGRFRLYNQTTSSEQLTVLNGGNVGIGTDSPGKKLDVAGEIKGTNLYAETYRSSRTDGDIYIQAASSTDFVSIGTEGGNNNVLRVQGNGKVGIGTTSPGYNLEVSDGNVGSNSSFNVGSANGKSYWTATYAASITNIKPLLDQDGNALQTGGGYRFTAHIDGTGTDQCSRAVFYNGNGTWYVNNTYASGSSSNNIEFLVSNGVPSVKTWHANNYNVRVWHERINLGEVTGTDNARGYFGADSYMSQRVNNVFMVSGDQASGNVGIGTTTPYGKLDVAGNIRLQSANQIYFGGTGSIPYWNVGVDNTTDLNFVIEGVSYYGGDRDIFLNPVNNGNVGINTTNPTSKLEVDGTINFNASGDKGFICNPGNGTFSLGDIDEVGGGGYLDGNSDDMRWYNSGNVKFKVDNNGTVTASGDMIAYGSPSDKRLKENIKPIESALDKAMKLQGVTFDWKESDSILNIKEDIGFIAQDVQKVVPELVRENKDGMLSMRHQGIAPILLEAIKELKAEIDLLKSKPCTCNKCNCNI